MTKGIFIAGTDTGVGKTIVSTAIIRLLMRRGLRVGAMKPIETGCPYENGVLTPTDGRFLMEAAEMDDSLRTVAPVLFHQPLAPMVAAGIENSEVDLGSIKRAYDYLSSKYEFVLVEGAGGIVVPIKTGDHGTYFMLDLIKDLRLPVVVVTRALLGAINHTLLTVDRAMREGVEVVGIVINHNLPPGDTVAEKTNPSVLREICPVPVLAEFPHVSLTIKEIEDAALRSFGTKFLSFLQLDEK